MAAANGLIDAAEATRNPYALSFALLAYGFAFRDADPDRALEAMRRGLVIAQDSGNRVNETHLAASLARLEAEHGDPLAALDYFARGDPQLPRLGQHHHDLRAVLAILAAFFDRLGRYEAGGHHRRFRRSMPYTAVSRARISAPRSPTYAMSSATRPTNRSPARARR